jgi:hypothetical protein
MVTLKRAPILISLFQTYHDLWGGYRFKSNGLTGRYTVSGSFEHGIGGNVEKVVIREGRHKVLKLSDTRTLLYDKSYSDRLDLYMDALRGAIERLRVVEARREKKIKDASF